MQKIHLIKLKNTLLIVFGVLFMLVSCRGQQKEPQKTTKVINAPISLGISQTEAYLSVLQNKTVGVVANQTSVFVNSPLRTHLVDSLLHLGVSVKKVFAPEHGFRGKADAGAHIASGKDAKTGLDIISIYGKNKKPSAEQLNGIDVMIFDIQDVGARFYTYISSLHYIMEACAEQDIPLLVLDRPNPNGHYIDGPVLEQAHRSFVGMHSVPVVHGMTIGEYAQMINGEKWLKNEIECNLTVVPCKNYTKDMSYVLPIKPSPNLPNKKAIQLYPSLCFFEGTPVSVGRGTDMQFQIYGSPSMPETNFSFTPMPKEGAKFPKHEGKVCFGEDLRGSTPQAKITLGWLIYSYQNTIDKSSFFSPFFTKLAGTTLLQQQIEKGLSASEISASWQKDLLSYNTLRKPYELY